MKRIRVIQMPSENFLMYENVTMDNFEVYRNEWDDVLITYDYNEEVKDKELYEVVMIFSEGDIPNDFKYMGRVDAVRLYYRPHREKFLKFDYLIKDRDDELMVDDDMIVYYYNR